MSCEHNNSMNCTCTYSCPRRGKCCECLSYHLKSDAFPACFFSEAAEKTYDRSFAALVRDRQG
ncbi:MAG: DUF6485 family protein [Clostridiales bacterium]|nr:DUF6485 family protein [Clostridiales bacterium]